MLPYLTMIATSVYLLFATKTKDRKSKGVTVVALSVGILSTRRTELLRLISGRIAIRLLQTK